MCGSGMCVCTVHVRACAFPLRRRFTVDGPACQQRYACYCCSGDHRSQLRLQVYAGEDTALRSPIGEVSTAFACWCGHPHNTHA